MDFSLLNRRARRRRKPVYDGAQFVGPCGKQGQLVQMQLPSALPLRMIYAFETGLHANRTEIDRESVRGNIEPMRGDPSMVVVDIEHLPVETVRRHPNATDADIQKGHDTLRMVLGEVRRRWPRARIGLFDMLPPQHMHAWNPEHPEHDRYKAALERGTYRVDPMTGEHEPGKGLLDAVDFLAPALYLHDQRIELYRRDRAWGKPDRDNRGVAQIRDWIAETVAAARTTGKPIYPFVWHRIHGGWKPNDDGFETAEYVGDDLYRLVLRTALEHADGVILWGRRERYNPSDPWQRIIRAAAKGAL